MKRIILSVLFLICTFLLYGQTESFKLPGRIVVKANFTSTSDKFFKVEITEATKNRPIKCERIVHSKGRDNCVFQTFEVPAALIDYEIRVFQSLDTGKTWTPTRTRKDPANPTLRGHLLEIKSLGDKNKVQLSVSFFKVKDF